MKIEIIAIGKAKDAHLLALISEYQKRLSYEFFIHEIQDRSDQSIEEKRILEKLKSTSYVIILDEKGKELSSRDFSQSLENIMAQGFKHIQFVIGGADGLTNNVKKRADLSLSFGRQTWPHMLVRLMLIEQIYRAQTILSGHPYHRD